VCFSLSTMNVRPGLFSAGIGEPWPVIGYSGWVIDREIEHAMLNLPGRLRCFSHDRTLVRDQMLSQVWTLQGFSEPCCKDEAQERAL